MDPTSWSAYSQHFSRLGASMNHPPGPLVQQAQMNDLALTSSLSRQEHIPGYGNSGGPHPFLLAAASHGLNASQANPNDPSFNANLFSANYDASLFSASFPPGSKGHLASFPQGAAGLFKAVNRENNFNDLRTGFSHCSMAAAYAARGADGSNGSGLGPGHLFPNSMPPGSWRHSGMIPSSCGPFGVLPHETVLQRSHLVGRGSEKLSSKQSRSSGSYVEQDLSRGYRGILSSPARPPSSYVDGSNGSHSSLLSPQNDPYFSSVSDNYYSSCSKNDFAAYSSYCSNVQQGVQRGYCYPQTFTNFEHNVEKQDVPTTSTSSANFTNYVPNSSLNGNPSHLHNGQISRQSVITTNVNNTSMYNSESHSQNHAYNAREPYPFPPGTAHANSCLSTHPTNRNEANSSRQSLAHSNGNPHSSTGQNMYPPMSTPIPASTPAHTTPPSSSMGHAYVPTQLPLSHDSGCSSVNSQSVLYNSPSNDGCYSTPGTGNSESSSPAKHELSRHSSPSVYSIESSNMSGNNGHFVDNHHVRSDVNYNVVNGSMTSELTGSAKVLEEERRRALLAGECRSRQHKGAQLPQVVPIDMVKLNKETTHSSDAPTKSRPANLSVTSQPHSKHSDPPTSSKSDSAIGTSNSPCSVLDFTSKEKDKSKRGQKRKSDAIDEPSPLNCTYFHLTSSESRLTSPSSATDIEETKTPSSNHSASDHSPAVNLALNSSTPSTSSPLPVDLSNSINLGVKKQNSAPEKEAKSPLPNLNYETDKSFGGKWSLTKSEAPAPEVNLAETPEKENPENLSIQDNLEKNVVKCESPLCRTPPMDDLSDDTKKLCNSIEEDLGFLVGLSSDPDVEDSASKGSFSEKKSKKDKGFLQSFLTFLDSSNEASTSNLVEKPESKKDKEKVDNNKSGQSKTLIDKDNFEEAPSLDPTLFGCSTLQKEMVVPNPEAPSFSSDEDENSTQGIFDSVAMAIQRLCEDNEEDHSEKGNKSSSKSSSKKEMPVLTNMTEVDVETQKPKKEEECTVKRFVKGRRGRRRRRHLLVIKVKRPVDKATVMPHAPKAPPVKRRRLSRTTANDVEIVKSVPSSQRQRLMRKCKENELRKKKSRVTKRKPRNCIKKKYALEEKDEAVEVISVETPSVTVKEEETEKKEKVSDSPESISTAPSVLLDIMTPQPIVALPQLVITSPQQQTTASPQTTHTQLSQAIVPPSTPKQVRPTALKKKKNFAIGYRTRKRRRKPRNQAVNQKIDLTLAPPPPTPVVVEELVEPPKVIEQSSATAVCTNDNNTDIQSKQTASGSDNCLNNETHFKTGDYVISIDSKDSDCPPMWRIEGKNVLQLFEVLENRESGSILYRNTSSYLRWSPSTKHKYLNQPVNIINSDDDTVIVELLKKSESLADDVSSRCDYSVHPQRENFDVYLQTLVSQALDSEFIPEIIKENDEYFLSHLDAIEGITSQKKDFLHQRESWSSQLATAVTTYPCISISSCEQDDRLCPVCKVNKIQCSTHFHGQPYDLQTLQSKESKEPACDFSLCDSCVQSITVYGRLHHHKYTFFQLACKKVNDVRKGEDKDSHMILEECLQDTEWMSQMFQTMLELWNSCDKYR